MKRIYVDTSVFGGCFDEEFSLYSDLFFKKVIESQSRILFSNVAESELKKAPEHVKAVLLPLPKTCIEKIILDEEAEKLATQYIHENVVGESSLIDCFHIAMASIHKADLLVSWNFKHIVNIDRIKGYNGVNLMNGYSIIEIRNPREAFDYEK